MPAIYPRTSLFFCAFLILAHAGHCAESATDVKVELSALPQKVSDAVKANYPKATMKRAEKRMLGNEFEHYCVELTEDNEDSHVYLEEDGTIATTGEELDENELPAKVKAAFEKDYSEWRLKEIYKETDAKTKEITYSIELRRLGKWTELIITPEGKITKTLDLIRAED